MSNGILSRLALAILSNRTSAELRVTAVGIDLPERAHSASGGKIGFVS
jgi:hypothetical protein